ncbi:MAG TPA: ATP-binding cassette domain-containing protein [Acidobacteriaceae bacterium]
MPQAIPSTSAAPVELPENMPVVEFKDVSIRFDVKPVLQNISFAVERGQTLIILGPAGCGKSVLLKLANGLLGPDSGSIKIFGKEITTMPERDLFELRAHIGMVFQESALFDSLTVEDNVAYRLHEEHVPEDEAHTRVVEALKFVELEQAISKFPSELSGGMRRRVSIARAIISGPDLILYDSPTGGLDPITSTTIIELVMKQRDVSHTTSLLVTHRLQDAFTLATHRYDAGKGMVELPKDEPNHGIDDGTKFLMLNEGSIVFHGTTEELIHSDDPWIKEYLS